MKLNNVERDCEKEIEYDELIRNYMQSLIKCILECSE